MVVVVAAEAVDVQRHARRLREALQAVRDHLAAQVPDLLALELQADHAEGPVREVDDGARERLVERRVRRAEACQARCAAQRAGERVAQRDAAVLGRVVVVDF